MRMRVPIGKLLVPFFALLVLWCGAAAASAQTFRGTILGTITDSSGASIAAASVTVKNVDTGLSRTVSTSDDGTYAVPELPIGTYTVTVEKDGFKQAIVTGIQVEVSAERRADVVLQPGTVSQTVEVTGEDLPQVESTSNVLGGLIESRVAANLPVNGRDYTKLVFLVPGVAGAPDMISDSPGSYGSFSVNGSRGRSNNFLLDGTDMNDGYRNDPAINEAGVFGTPATILPVEAIAEMHVASNFEAEYGRSAGAVVNIVTKSGTNGLHGTAFNFFRNTDLNARNFFNTVPEPQQPFHDNQFGAALGGPIIKDKTFFFVDYEGVREVGTQSSAACVPTAADYAANTPAGGINPVIQNLLSSGKAWPTPTQPNVDCYVNGGTNTTLATPFSNRVDSAIVKIDHSFNANNLLTGRYYIGDSLQSFPLALSGGGQVPGYNTVTPTRVQLVSISFVSTITPAIVNEARIGWNRFAEGFFPEGRSFDPTSIGLDTVGPGTVNNGNPFNFGLPAITIFGTSFPQLGADKGDPRQRVDSNWHFIDNVSWKAGRNDIKFGFEFRRTSISQIFNRDYRGRLQFLNLEDFLAGTPATKGTISSANSQYAGDSNRNTFENSYAAYLQDSIRLNRRLTLNLGLRYDYFGIVQEKHDLFTNVDPTTGLVFPVGNARLYQPDYRNWAPRASLAWDVTGRGRTVVRAGYGIFYDAFSQDLFLGHLPYSTNYAPGPAYSGIPGPGQISTAGASSAPLTPGVPVFDPAAFAGVPDAFGVDPHIRTPYVQNFNLNLQQELTRRSVLQIGYVGSTGRKLFDFRDINQPSAATISAYDYAALGCCVPGPLNPNRNYIYWQESAAKSSYNSLQASWRINGWHGLTSTLNYVWSHSIDDASDGEDYVPNAAQPTDSTSLASNRGNSNFDVRNRLTWNFIYEFPNPATRKKLTNGWGINGVLTAQSGQPFHLIWTSDDYDGSGTFFSKPDIVGPIQYNYSDPTQFLNLSSFAVPCTLNPAGPPASITAAQNCEFTTSNSMHFGNEGRNSLVGPSFHQFDFSIFKNTAITERLKLELRVEAYNLLNHPNFASPLYPGYLANADFNGIASGADTLGSACHPTAGAQVALGRGCGFFPLTVTGDVGIGYPFLGGGGPRSLQIAAKFTF